MLEEAEVVKVTLDKKNDSSRQITKSNEVAQLMENVEENRAKENEKKAREREREAQVEETKARREIGKQFLNGMCCIIYLKCIRGKISNEEDSFKRKERR